MNSERIDKILSETAFPESRSVHQALLQVWNECQQENNLQLVERDATMENMAARMQEMANELIEKEREISKWIPVTTKPEFDGEYLCCLFETEECGITHIKQRVLSNHFNVWMVKANQSVLFWMPLPKQP